MQIYRIKENEDIYKAAARLGVSPHKLAEHNDAVIRSRLPEGKELTVITPTRTYTVRRGDTLDSISKRFEIPCSSIHRMNPELCGDDHIYTGQLLYIKSGSERYGMISTNGYMYQSCPRERLLSLMPYLTYITLCSSVYKDGAIDLLFDVRETVEIIRKNGRIPVMRIYMAELPDKEATREFADSAAILAGSAGFDGITISNIGKFSASPSLLDGFMLEVRKRLMENDLLLLCEADADGISEYTEYSDMSVLTYDKLHKSNMPSFKDGECSAFEGYAEKYESSRAFMELSSFAFAGGKYIDKSEAMRITDKKRGRLCYDEASKTVIAAYGKSKRREIIYESLENTKAKLELVSELGYMGVSFDIGRICTPELIMMSWMFGIVEKPSLTGSHSDLNCRGEERDGSGN